MDKNEVLAKWAGFSYHEEAERPVSAWGDNSHETYTFKYWLGPSDDEPIELPDFLHSLDALAKWLVPKACYEYGDAIVYELLASVIAKVGLDAEACAEAILGLIRTEDGQG